MTEKGVGIQAVLQWPKVSGWKHPHRKHLKTTSEWPSSGPVTPLSSNEAGYLLDEEMPIRVEPRELTDDYAPSL